MRRFSDASPCHALALEETLLAEALRLPAVPRRGCNGGVGKTFPATGAFFSKARRQPVVLARMLPENLRALQNVRVAIDEGMHLNSYEIQEFSDFRRRIMTMKTDVDLAADHRRLATFVEKCPLVVRVRAGGVLAGTFAVRWLDLAGDVRLLLPEYFFFDGALRGTPALPWAVLRSLVQHRAIFQQKTVYLGGIGYPTGVLAAETFFGRAHFLGDDAHHDALLEQVIAEMGPTYLREAGYSRMPTIPPRPSARWFARMEARLTYRRYVERCPAWLDGYALPVVLRVAGSEVGRAVAKTVTRSLRKRWGRINMSEVTS
jgi:hypothetical protein